MTAPARASFLTNPLMLDATVGAVDRQAVQATAVAPGELLPPEVRTFLARARLLEGVPFQHLVPDSALLPPESIRFFFLDREWTDALVQGALSVGTVTTLDHYQLEQLHLPIRDEVDGEERRVRMVGGEQVGFAPAGAVTGFLLRSRAVSGWPALHVRGYAADNQPDEADFDAGRVRLLRLERLAPAVLLCLFDGVPTVVHIEEPRQGVQYGIDLIGLNATLHLRDVTDGKFIEAHFNAKPPFTVQVPFRNIFTGTEAKAGPPGVVAVRHLGQRMSAISGTKISQASTLGITSAEVAMELVQFPYRQVFGPGGAQFAASADVAFAPAIADRAPDPGVPPAAGSTVGSTPQESPR